METGSSFTSGAVRLIGGSNGNSSTNDAWSATASSSPQLQINVQSLSNLTINGDLELKAGTCRQERVRERRQASRASSTDDDVYVNGLQARLDGATTCRRAPTAATFRSG
jgi:hypothetical protein